MALADKFGDSGLVSVLIARRDGDSMEIVTWLMSCRVVARRLEEFVLDRIVEVAAASGHRPDSGPVRADGEEQPRQRSLRARSGSGGSKNSPTGAPAGR